LVILFTLPLFLSENDFLKDKNGKATLIIDKGEGEEKVFEREIKENMTVFDFLKETELEIEYKEYDFGVFVQSIDGLKNNEEGKNWLYYVNDKQPQMGSDQRPVFPGDEIRWKYEKPNW